MGIKKGFSSIGRALKDVLEGEEEGAEDILGDAEEREFKRYEEKQRKKELKAKQKQAKAEAKEAREYSRGYDDYDDSYDDYDAAPRSEDKIWPPRSPEGNYSKALSGSGDYQRVRSYSSTFIAREFKDAQVISDALLNGQEITVNFAQAVPSDTQRIMDFICGCIYVINGTIKPVSNDVYLFIPGQSPEPEYNSGSAGSSKSGSGRNINRMI